MFGRGGEPCARRSDERDSNDGRDDHRLLGSLAVRLLSMRPAAGRGTLRSSAHCHLIWVERGGTTIEGEGNAPVDREAKLHLSVTEFESPEPKIHARRRQCSPTAYARGSPNREHMEWSSYACVPVATRATHLGDACLCMCAKTCSMARGMMPRSSADAPRLNPSIVNVFPVPCVSHFTVSTCKSVRSHQVSSRLPAVCRWVHRMDHGRRNSGRGTLEVSPKQ